MVLGWHENLLPEEVPPEWMWPLTDELEGWFEEVAERRKEMFGGREELEDAPDMMQNELTQGRVRR